MSEPSVPHVWIEYEGDAPLLDSSRLQGFLAERLGGAQPIQSARERDMFVFALPALPWGDIRGKRSSTSLTVMTLGDAHVVTPMMSGAWLGPADLDRLMRAAIDAVIDQHEPVALRFEPEARTLTPAEYRASG